MVRVYLLAVLVAASAAFSPTAAGAVTVSAGPQGRALLTMSSGSGMLLVERTASGRFTSAQALAGPEVFPVLNAWGPGGVAIVVALDQSVEGARKLVVFRRAGGATIFAPPVTIAQATTVEVHGAAADANGDVAVLVQLDDARPVLLTALRGGAFGAPQKVAAGTEGVAVAVGGGRVVVAYFDVRERGVRVLTGAVGSPVGPAQGLTSASLFSEVAAAVDDVGYATVAFARSASRGARTTLLARRARGGKPFGSPSVIARGGPSNMGAGFASVRLAAAGATTALTWDPNEGGDPKDSDGRHGVSIARGAGRFGRVERPSSPPLGPFGTHGWPLNPVVAVDKAGDVLFAYTYGIYGNAVHVAQRRASSARFTAPRVASTLGHGGTPTVALLDDRTPLVAWQDSGGALEATSRIRGPRPGLNPPRAMVAFTRGTEARLRATNAVRVRISCSQPCIVQARATLRTKTGRTFAYADAMLRRAGNAVTKRFAFDPTRNARRARAGARVRVTVDVENASGASSEVVKQITLRD